MSYLAVGADSSPVVDLQLQINRVAILAKYPRIAVDGVVGSGTLGAAKKGLTYIGAGGAMPFTETASSLTSNARRVADLLRRAADVAGVGATVPGAEPPKPPPPVIPTSTSTTPVTPLMPVPEANIIAGIDNMHLALAAAGLLGLWYWKQSQKKPSGWPKGATRKRYNKRKAR